MRTLLIKFLISLGIIIALTAPSLQAGWRDTLTSDSFNLEVPGEHSPTKKPVYKGEYGVFIPIDDQVTQSQAKDIADKYGSAPITPHVSLIQGKFEPNQLENVQSALQKISEQTDAFIINFKDEVVKDKSGNSFWEVDFTSDSWDLLNIINIRLCELIPHPVGILKQIYESDTSAEEDRLIEKYGRDFNVPGSNNPHITVAYGIQNEEATPSINAMLVDKEWCSKALRICYGKIDLVGNIYTTEGSYYLG